VDRRGLLEHLREAAARRHLVPIVGTGVSVALSGNPSIGGHRVATWAGLLRHGVSRCEELGLADGSDARILREQIDSGKTDFLISAAESVTRRLADRSEGTYRGWLKETVGSLRVADAAIATSLSQLSAVLATLNYDTLLEAATSRTAVTWLEADRVQDVLRGETDDAILHLHGSFTDPRSVVFGITSYIAASGDPHASEVLRVLTMDRTILFVGCGDTLLDPNFAALLRWASSALTFVTPRHCFLCRTCDLPAVRLRLGDAPWLLPLAYGDVYEDLHPFLRSLTPSSRSETGGGSQPRLPALDLDGYRQAMIRRYARVKLEEIEPTTSDLKRVMLESLFVEQAVKDCGDYQPLIFELPKDKQGLVSADDEAPVVIDDASRVEIERAKYSRQATIAVQSLFNSRKGRAVILGDPGSGKSTLFQHIVLEWADLSPDVDSRLPLLIELGDYARLRGTGQILDFLGYLHSGATVRWHFDREGLEHWLFENTTNVLFDGLDEVLDRRMRKEVSTAIGRFADRYPRAAVYVSSRVVGFNHQLWRDEGFDRFMLQDLDERRIDTFLRRWHEVVYDDGSRAERKRLDLSRALATSAAVRRLAGNPLLLTMMAILNRVQELPRDRAELYEQCARLLLHQWKTDEAFEAEDLDIPGARLDFRDKRYLLMRVARVMHEEAGGLSGNVISEVALEAALAAGLASLRCGRPDYVARRLIEQLHARNFMLSSIGGRCYAFVHRTFLEYFAALEICERFQGEQTLTLDELQTRAFGQWRDDAWHETLRLLAGMLAPRFVGLAIDWLIQQHPSQSHPALLAARCVGEVRLRDGLGDTPSRVLQKALELYEWCLARRDYQAVDSVLDTFASVWSHDPAAELWFMSVAEAGYYGAHKAFDILSDAWNSPRVSLSWVRFLADACRDEIVRLKSVEALVQRWKDDGDTLPFLKHLGRSEPDFELRLRVVELVGLHWGGTDPSVARWLRARATGDARRQVRGAAITALGRHCSSDEANLRWMMDLAQTEEDSHIRRAGVRIVVTSWPADPTVLPWLRTIVSSEVDQVVRYEAILRLVELSTVPDAVRLIARLETEGVDADLLGLARQILQRERGELGDASADAPPPRG
jgi:hypothetical protein